MKTNAIFHKSVNEILRGEIGAAPEYTNYLSAARPNA